ncbi:hypothetical protein NL676_000756 [Syzygium grande]|nr:hypothetical protein NL676_000756 [Syzygium grande]
MRPHPTRGGIAGKVRNRTPHFPDPNPDQTVLTVDAVIKYATLRSSGSVDVGYIQQRKTSVNHFRNVNARGGSGGLRFAAKQKGRTQGPIDWEPTALIGFPSCGSPLIYERLRARNGAGNMHLKILAWMGELVGNKHVEYILSVERRKDDFHSVLMDF